MEVGVLSRDDYPDTGIGTFESNVIPYLLEKDNFHSIKYNFSKYEKFNSLNKPRRALGLRRKLKNVEEEFDRIFIPSQTKMRFDPESIEAEIIPFVHDIIPYVTDYSRKKKRGTVKSSVKALKGAVKRRLGVDYLPYITRVEKVMTASEFSASELEHRTAFSGSTNVVYQGVDDKPSLEDEETKKRDIDLLYVGELYESKNPEFIRKTLSKACKKGFSVKTVSFREKNLPGDNKTDLSDEEIGKIYSRSRYYLHPSHVEGFGRCAVEAQRYGCLPLALDRPINHEILGKLGESWEIIQKPEDVLKNLELKLNQRRREKAVENSKKFSWQKCRKKVEEVLKHEKNY